MVGGGSLPSDLGKGDSGLLWRALGTERGRLRDVQDVEFTGLSDGVDDGGRGEGCVKDD